MIRRRQAPLTITLALLVAVLAAGLAWWWTRPLPPAPAAPIASLKVVDFGDLPGWADDDHAKALAAFRVSCTRLVRLGADRKLGRAGLAGQAKGWHEACQAAETASDARDFFESQFRPVAVIPTTGKGLFTGYYEPLLRGSRTADATYRVPLHKRPDDMITADLGKFRDELKGKRVTGRVKGGELVPYYSRAEIGDGALDGRGLELVWVDDPVDAFFLQIQGSGVVALPDGTTMRVGYAAQNGHPYFAIGRELIRRNAVPRERMSMQAIRAWLAANPDEGDKVMRMNPSYVFFRENTAAGAIGAQGVVLTPDRSLAVDRRIYPMGVPIWLDTKLPDDQPLRRLMLAQDTGGAIRGPVRGDVFFGAGDAAGALAGRMKQAGDWYLLLPKTVDPPALLY
ncbi:MAG: murein transglycosylase A [Alphaproteobacteria bacterium]